MMDDDRALDHAVDHGLCASTVATAEEIPAGELLATDRTEELTYDSVTNFARAAKGCSQLCVMCGSGAEVVIPRQNKDVCRDCDKAVWRHRRTGAYFKWCKGCKNFLQIGNFSQKLDAAKCDKCRERGRTSYLLKKRHATTDGSVAQPSCRRPDKKKKRAQFPNVDDDDDDNFFADGDTCHEDESHKMTMRPTSFSETNDKLESDGAAAILALAKTPEDTSAEKVSSRFGTSLAKLSESETSSQDDPTENSTAGESEHSSGLLFELAAIHSTILNLERRADLVPKLEAAVAQLTSDKDRLKAELSAALAREKEANAKMAQLNASSSDDDDAPVGSPSRPRLISFDAPSETTHGPTTTDAV